MIARLVGALVEKNPDGRVVIDCGGVGYLCACSATTLGALPQEGSEASLFVQTVVREDAINLYGFATPGERDLFVMLTDVDKVGPKIALQLLSGIGVGDLAQAVMTSNTARLTAVPGVGPKLASRLVVELGDKLRKRPDLAAGAQAAQAATTQASTAASRAQTSLRDRNPELYDVLIGAGHRPPDIARAFDHLDAMELGGADLATQFRETARLLTRGKLTREA